jgi:ribosomal protein L4
MYSGIFSPSYDARNSGVHDLSPRDDEDFVYTQGMVVPGAHPLPIYHAKNSLTHPLASPYMPSPHRPHPYFTGALPELPHFNATVPIVYPRGTIKIPIVVPVYDASTGAISHTRELDPWVFGCYPEPETLDRNATYWQVRCQNYRKQWDFNRLEIWRKAKKNWPCTGMGLPRQSDRKHHRYRWGGRPHAAKPWNMLMPTMPPEVWHQSNRQMLTLKMLQGRLQIVDRLTLPEPSHTAFLELCDRMGWDVRHDGAGVLFMDGGSRLTPSIEFDRSFFYGSFHNGRVKVVRPTVTCDRQYDWNQFGAQQSFKGPKGAKNPIPINRFNVYDALEHDRLVITEGAVLQLEREMHYSKLMVLPPHVREAMAERGMLDSPALGDAPMPLGTIEAEAAGRTEEMESKMYEPHYDNPYKPWPDEKDAGYVVDAVRGVVERFTNGKKTSWKMLE